MIESEIERREIASLPRWWQVAFAARCARRLERLFDLWVDSEDGRHSLKVVSKSGHLRDHFESPNWFQAAARFRLPNGDVDPAVLSRAIDFAELSLSSSRYDFQSSALMKDELYHIVQLSVPATEGGRLAVAAADAGRHLLEAASQAASHNPSDAPSWGVVGVVSAAWELPSSREAITSDLQALKNYVTEARPTDPHDRLPVDFYPTRVEFDTEQLINGESVIETAGWVREEVISRLAAQPKDLLTMHDRAFEELIAELWDGFGWDVSLTAKTRDGGADIIAIQSNPARAMYLIECKRWKKPVGVKVVRELRGAVTEKGATKGIIATTSRFTGPARKSLASPEGHWRLEGADLDRVIEWLRAYEKRKLMNLVDLDFNSWQ